MKNYNFYNLIQLDFDYGNRNRFEAYFDNEYKRIANVNFNNNIRNKPEAIIKVNIVKVLPQAIKDDMYHKKSFKGLFTYEYLIRGLNTNKVKIYFKDHLVSKVYLKAVGVYLQAQVIEPIMYLKLLENDILFMHAAGVAKGDKGYLMPAHGGTGKTTTCIALLNNGFKLLGDDLLLVDKKSGYVFPYPRPLHLFTYNIRNLQGAKIPTKYWFIIYFKNVIRFFLEKILRTDFLISTRVHADELYEGQIFSKPVKYEKALFLTKKGEVKKTEKINKNSVNYIAKKIVYSADLNDSLYTIVPKKYIKKLKELEINVISNTLLGLDYITFINTRETDFSNQDTIDELF